MQRPGLMEFRTNWRAVAAAALGLGVGYTFNNYVTNVLSPYFIADFGWSKANFALLGLVVVVAAICQPVAGRLTDAFGVRNMARVGVIAAPLLYLALSWQQGPFWQFYLLNLLQVIVVGGTTSVVIYTKLLQPFDAARGIALGITACAPALLGALLAPAIGAIAESWGWRAAYMAVAAFTAIVGAIALHTIPEGHRNAPARQSAAGRPKVSYLVLLRDPSVLILLAGMVLCNLSLTLQMTQVKLVLLDIGISDTASSSMITLYGFGVIAGRLGCGIALDRFPPTLVAAIMMSAPAIGLFTLAAAPPMELLTGLAVVVLGFSMGAEGDVGAFLVMRHFGAEIYGTVFGLLMGAISFSGALGALMLSASLAMSDGSFAPFLVFTGVAALLGGTLFLLLGTRPVDAEPGPQHS